MPSLKDIWPIQDRNLPPALSGDSPMKSRKMRMRSFSLVDENGCQKECLDAKSREEENKLGDSSDDDSVICQSNNFKGATPEGKQVCTAIIPLLVIVILSSIRIRENDLLN